MVVQRKWYCTVFSTMMLLMNCFLNAEEGSLEIIVKQQQPSLMITGYSEGRPACDEIYEVKEAETLQKISENHSSEKFC
ncbi:hypothetical protein Bca101_045655 [Brassica carinata]